MIITNLTDYPSREVVSLIKFAHRHVRSHAKELRWLSLFERLRVSIRLSKPTRINSHYSAYYNYTTRFGYLVQEYAHHPEVDKNEFVHEIVIRMGDDDCFPIMDATDNRYKGMPKVSLMNWQECLVMIAAHELGHIKYLGNKEGECNCDLLGVGAVNRYRLQTSKRASSRNRASSLEHKGLSREMCAV